MVVFAIIILPITILVIIYLTIIYLEMDNWTIISLGMVIFSELLFFDWFSHY